MSSSTSTSRSSAASAPWDIASPADKPGVVNRHLGIGWEYVHVCIDDASRVAFVQVMANQRKESAVAFLVAAVAYYAKLGISIERVMTDNGSCYRSKTFRAACKRLGLRQLFTRPYTPRRMARPSASSKPHFVNGPMLVLIKTPGSTNLPSSSNWLHRYNWHRPHASLESQNTYQSPRSFRGQPVEAPQLAKYNLPIAVSSVIDLLTGLIRPRAFNFARE